MKNRLYVISGLLAACIALSACGGEDDADEENGAAAEAPIADPVPAPDAVMPVEAADIPITIDDVIGVWGNEELCTAEPLTISPDFVSVADEACIVTSINGAEAGLSIGLLCPVEGAEPRPETWIVTTLGEAVPATGIAIARGGEIAEWTRCPSS